MIKYYLTLAISIIFNCLSLILLKKAMIVQEDFGETLTSVQSWFQLITNGYVLTGVIFFSISFVTWMISLVKIDLSLAYPTVSLSYIIIALMSHYLFNEHITMNRWIGILIIMIGIFVMYKK